MPEVTPSFVMQYEREMRAIAENEYSRRLLAENQWADQIVRTLNIQRKAERVTWLLNTAIIEPVGLSGSGDITFEDMVTQTVEYPVMRHGKGIIVSRDQIEDLDGTGLNTLSTWAADMGNEMAYYKQRQAAQLILNGAATDGSANCYDGVPFFTAGLTVTPAAPTTSAHPYNPFKTSLGGFANWLKGGASGSYPGACAIDDSVTPDVALTNLAKAIAYVATLKMPNGVDPRFLKPAFIMCAPRMAPRLRQLMDAKFIAQAAATGGGAGDVEALISGWGLGKPIVAQEIGSAMTQTFQMPIANATTGAITTLSETVTGSDTTWYLVCQENRTTQLGGLLHVVRKPFKMNFYTGETIPELDRRNQFEYHVQGRASSQYGHPYSIFRIDNA